MIGQTAAIFVDAYRELNAKKLFWVTLGISAAVVLAFAGVGIDERGLHAFGVFVGPWLNTTMVPAASFYKYLFALLGVPIWLTWGATILALVSTAPMIPDFVSGGSIDLMLSKPIGRARLFLTKYASALLFAGLQVTAFSGAAFVVIGVRGGSWEWSVFLAIPLVIAFFSYIYCVCALVGLVTRSTIAALLGALMFWLLIFGVHATESIYLMVKVATEQRVVALEEREASMVRQLGGSEPAAAAPEGFRATLAEAARAMLSPGGTDEEKRERLEASLAKTREALERERKDLRSYRKGHGITLAVKTALPKTSETMQVLTRSMLSVEEIAAIERRDDFEKYAPPRNPDDPAAAVSDRKAQETVERLLRERSVWWVIGTSLLFEAVMVALATRIFVRRDF